MIQDLSSKTNSTVLLLVELPGLKEMRAVAINHGFSSLEVERWLGVSLDRMFLLTYKYYNLSRNTHALLDRLLDVYEPQMWNAVKRLLDCLRIDPDQCFEVKIFDNYTLVIKCQTTQEVGDVLNEIPQP